MVLILTPIPSTALNFLVFPRATAVRNEVTLSAVMFSICGISAYFITLGRIGSRPLSIQAQVIQTIVSDMLFLMIKSFESLISFQSAGQTTLTIGWTGFTMTPSMLITEEIGHMDGTHKLLKLKIMVKTPCVEVWQPCIVRTLITLDIISEMQLLQIKFSVVVELHFGIQHLFSSSVMIFDSCQTHDRLSSRQSVW